MATTIPHRELRNNSSEILRRANQGEVFDVTNNGEVVAQLRPPTSSGLDGVPHRGALVRGGFDEIELVDPAGTTQEILDYLRGER